jgi:hypothetical protein
VLRKPLEKLVGGLALTNSTTGDAAALGERIDKLEHLARHHRAHINALEALLLQVLPGSGVDDETLKATLSKLLPNQAEAEQSASDRVAVLLGLHNTSDS